MPMRRKVRVPFRQRVATSWQILKEVRRFLSAERDLWVFVALAGLLFAAFMAAVFVAIPFSPQPEPTGPFGAAGMSLPILAVVALAGIPLMVGVSICNSALAFATWGRLEGQRTTKREAWQRALGATGTLVRFNIFAAVVGLFVATIGSVLERFRLIPGIGHIANLVGMYGWALASYFVIPVIVVERERRASGALKRSVQIVRQELGTSVTGLVTVQLVLMLVLVPIMLLVTFGTIFGLIMMAERGTALIAPSFVFPVMTLAIMLPVLLAFVLSNALTTTYQTALYRYAMTRRISTPFSVETLDHAWAPYRAK